MSQVSKNEIKKEEKVIALIGGTVIDGTGADPVANTTVLIKGEKIVKVGQTGEIAIPENAMKLDVSGKCVLPGFIDVHIHTTFPYSTEQGLSDTNSLATLRGLHLMNLYLRSGVTSVRDVGAPVETMQALVQAASEGYTNSIRLFSCGKLITVTGGAWR